MDTRRLILFVVFSFSILMLWDSWQRKAAPTQAVTANAPAGAALNAPEVNGQAPLAQADAPFKLVRGQRIVVNTDLYQAEIDTTGGDLRRLVLNKHRADDKTAGNFVLMDDAQKPMLYIAQTGLKGAALPDHNSTYTSAAATYTLAEGAQSQEVRLSWVGQGASQGLSVDKIYTFHRNQYAVDVRYEVSNNTAAAINPSAYYQIVHDSESNQGSRLMPTFTGGAYFNQDKKYNKIKFDEMAKEDLALKSDDGWAGLVQHYFASAWIAKAGAKREFYTRHLSEKIYSVGTVAAMASIAPGAKGVAEAKLFAGPQTQADLDAAAPGLEYVVDYGWLSFIAKPLFWLLSHIHGLVGNWGVAIILLTILIKAAFFRLSASGYRNMAQMRELAPRLQALKEKFGDDRQKFQQAMVEMYRTEKINPMGGCFPILIQIPVFIALYWMLSAVVEMRHAPFFGWIQDLSAIDPLYILPVLMGATMIVQSFLNPPPTDPIQAKMMKIMPVVFSVFFFFFPAGLVLYWLVNNVLSIAQQWYINKTIHAEALVKKGSGKR